MSKAFLSILGLYQYDNTIFDDVQVPEGLDKETLIDSIIQDCMELELLFPDSEAMRTMMRIWSRREMPTWQAVYNAERVEYNPIENYDRLQTDNRQVKHSGTDTSSNSGNSDSTHKYTSFDSDTLHTQTQDVDTASNSASLTHGENVADDFTSRIHGNIGVTTSQQMLESELLVRPKLNTINYIVNSFKMRFCILIY